MLVFIVMRVLPGDEITARLGIEAGTLTETQRESLERYYGLDRPLIGQFFSWLGSVLTGNFGLSVTSGQPVRKLIVEALPVTIELAILVHRYRLARRRGIGVFAASRVNRVGDVVGQGFGLFGLGRPQLHRRLDDHRRAGDELQPTSPPPPATSASSSRRWRTCSSRSGRR